MYEDEASVFNLSTTDNDIINLYAIWKGIDEIIIKDYEKVDDEYITGLEHGTSVSDYKEMFDVSSVYEIIVYNGDTELGINDLVGTGTKVKIYKNNVLVQEYTNILLGDTDGNGEIGYMDYVKVYNHIRKVKDPSSDKKLLVGAYLIAGDMSSNSEIDYMDYVKIYNKIKAIKESGN